jgi:hypothetical protein
MIASTLGGLSWTIGVPRVALIPALAPTLASAH